MEAIHYQNTKGVLVLDSNGSLSLSIPSNSTISGYNTTEGRVNILENKDNFNFENSHGILVYKHGSTQNIICITCQETSDSNGDKKTIRFTLEPNSVVPTTLQPTKFNNVTDIVLSLSYSHEIPQYKSNSVSSPQQNSLLSSLPAGIQNMVMQKSQNMTNGVRQGQRQKVLINQASGNPEHDKRVNDITARMLNETETFATDIMSSRPPPSTRPVRNVAPSSFTQPKGSGLDDSLASLKNSIKNGSNTNAMNKLNNIMAGLNLKTQPAAPAPQMQIPANLLEDSPAQQKAQNLLKMLGSTLGKLKH